MVGTAPKSLKPSESISSIHQHKKKSVPKDYPTQSRHVDESGTAVTPWKDFLAPYVQPSCTGGGPGKGLRLGSWMSSATYPMSSPADYCWKNFKFSKTHPHFRHLFECPNSFSSYILMGGGCGRRPVEVSYAGFSGIAGTGGASGGRTLGLLGARGTALLLGRTTNLLARPPRLGLLERARLVDGAVGPDHLGVATSVPDTGRGIFLGWGGRSAATHRPEKIYLVQRCNKNMVGHNFGV